jgi:hypothetical protein
MDFFIKEYDNVLTQHQIDSIAKELLSDKIPWHWHLPGTVTDDAYENDADKNTVEAPQFVHRFNQDDGTPFSQYSNITDYIFSKFLEHEQIKFKKLGRVKGNLQLQNLKFTSSNYNTPHVDTHFPHLVLLYYVNNSDGDTRIFNKTENGEFEVVASITPKAGKFVLFNGEYYHAGSHPVASEYRSVVNFNLMTGFKY